MVTGKWLDWTNVRYDGYLSAFVDGCSLELWDVEGKFIVTYLLACTELVNRWDA